MRIDQILSKKWSAMNGDIPRQIFQEKRQKKRKNNGNKGMLASFGRKQATVEDHHVWSKPYRNGRDVHRRNEIKAVDPMEHDIWNKHAKDMHPKIAFGNIIKLCSGKVEATEEESKDLAILAGFDWRKDPNAAIVAIFEKFMPDELGGIIKPYVNRIK